MGIDGDFTLPADLVVVPVARLAPEAREGLAHEPDDYCVTRPLGRSPSTIVDRATARLLEQFRTPVGIVDAVIGFCADEGLDPRTTLDGAFAALRSLAQQGFLLPAGSQLVEPVASSLCTGATVHGFEVVEPVHLVVDTEVHHVRGADGASAALKTVRPGAEAVIGAMLRDEADVLRLLDGQGAPALLASGEADGRPYLVMQWCPAVDAFTAAAEARALGPAGDEELLDLVVRVMEAYERLHGLGVLHGDIHPRNVLVGPRREVSLIDFGMAVAPGLAGGRRGRGGIDFYQEPELARALLAGARGPAPSAAGEQYALAAMVYLLLTGGHTHDFSLERDEMLRQLLEQPPVAFRQRGAQRLGAVEAVVARALAKEPGDRHASVRDFRRAFQNARVGLRPVPRTHGPADELLDRVLQRLVDGADPADPAHLASAMNGAAGRAYALLRLARARGDGQLLAAADLWSVRAVEAARGAGAFTDPDLGIVPEIVGRNSFYHHGAGVYAVQALIAHARDDAGTWQKAADAFAAVVRDGTDHGDAAFGRAGFLLGCALLLEAAPAAGDTRALRSLGDELASALAADPLPEALGAAHGRAGVLFAVLRWSQAAAVPPPAGTEERLDVLGALGRPAGRGLRWPYAAGGTVPRDALAAGWCNGAAGHAQLWVLARTLLGHDRYLAWARGAGWTAAEAPRGASGMLCCGAAGQAYALLALHRCTGEPHWPARARALADHAAGRSGVQPERRGSLYQGEVGIALLAGELRAAAGAGMPLYGAEGWPRHGS